MEAVVYTSNTGSTEHYAKLLGDELRMPVYSEEEAKKYLYTGAEIIYLGWIMAGKFQCRKTSWNVQNDDEHYGEDSRKSSGEES